jgi:hypothetical protein
MYCVNFDLLHPSSPGASPRVSLPHESASKPDTPCDVANVASTLVWKRTLVPKGNTKSQALCAIHSRVVLHSQCRWHTPNLNLERSGFVDPACQVPGGSALFKAHFYSGLLYSKLPQAVNGLEIEAARSKHRHKPGIENEGTSAQGESGR